jgi:hypothetical protein
MGAAVIVLLAAGVTAYTLLSPTLGVICGSSLSLWAARGSFGEWSASRAPTGSQ